MIHRLFNASMLLVTILISGCNVCFAPGAGYSSATVSIDVPVKVTNANKDDPSTLWIDSGETVDADSTIPIVISGVVNFCEDEVGGEEDCDKSPNCKRALLTGFTCIDGRTPQYDRDPKTGKPSHNTGHDYLCPNGIMRYPNYVDTGLLVNPGDAVTFKLVPAISITIDNCKVLPEGVSTFEGCHPDGSCIDDNDCVKNFSNKKCIDPVTLCESGATIDLHGNEYKVEPFLGKKYTSMIDNYFTPYSNKIYFSNTLTQPLNHNFSITDSAVIDLREPIISFFDRKEYDYDCKLIAQDIIPFKESNVYSYSLSLSQKLKKFSTYNVLYRCNIINKFGTNKWTMFVDNNKQLRVMSTISYEWQPRDSSNDVERNRILKIRELGNTSLANHTIAKVGDKNVSYNAIGAQCLISNKLNEQCSSNSERMYGIALNHPYKIDDSVKPNSSVMISNGYNQDHESVFAGGYHFEVRKSCIKENGDKLYMYIGDSKPKIRPGDEGTYHLKRTITKSDTGIMTTPQFIINKDNPVESGKIYFGIKGAEDSDTFKKSTSSPENKYSVTIIKAKFYPRFSEPFNYLIDVITKILYGDGNGSNGIIRTMYENITGPSNFNAIQAVLALYISLYGVMFLMGLIDHPQVDLFIRIIKIAFIMLLFSKQSWDFFGYSLHSFFIKGSKYLIGAFSGVLETENNSFKFFDMTFGALLTSETWLRFLSLIFSGPAGFLAFLLIIWGICLFAMAFVEAIIAYIMAIIALSIVFVLSPVFITFILFQRTRGLFDGWIKMLVNFSLKPVFLFSGLAFLNQILLATFYAVNNFGVCTKKCWIYIILFKDGKDTEGLCFFDAIAPMGFSQTDTINDRIKQSTQDIEGMGFMGLPFTISSLVIFLVVANLMKIFSGISESIVQAITGSMSSMMEANKSASQALLSVFGKDDETKHAIKNADNSQNKGKQRAKFKGVHDDDDKGAKSNKSANSDDGSENKSQSASRNTDKLSLDDLNSPKLGSDSTDPKKTGSDSADQSSTMRLVASDNLNKDLDSTSMHNVGDASNTAKKIDEINKSNTTLAEIERPPKVISEINLDSNDKSNDPQSTDRKTILATDDQKYDNDSSVKSSDESTKSKISDETTSKSRASINQFNDGLKTQTSDSSEIKNPKENDK